MTWWIILYKVKWIKTMICFTIGLTDLRFHSKHLEENNNSKMRHYNGRYRKTNRTNFPPPPTFFPHRALPTSSHCPDDNGHNGQLRSRRLRQNQACHHGTRHISTKVGSRSEGIAKEDAHRCWQTGQVWSAEWEYAQGVADRFRWLSRTAKVGRSHRQGGAQRQQ